MDHNINTQSVLDVLDRYYGLLRQTGYVKQTNTARVIVSTFLLTLLSDAGSALSDKDKEIINGTFRKLHVHGEPVMW